MKKTTALFMLWCTISVASLIYACNANVKETPKEEAVINTDTTETMKAATEPVFTPFDVVEISHTVNDYNKWRPFFNSDSTARKANGLKDEVVGRGVENPNKLVVVLQSSDIQKAKDFAADPRLKTVMEKSGVNSKPDVQYFHVIRFNPEAKEKTWVLITHKVKDFNAWLAVFDKEGTAGRASQGLYDVALAQGIDDPNLVHIVLDIKDLKQAKASMFSEEKKKLMSEAGVEGEPSIQFYKTAE